MAALDIAIIGPALPTIQQAFGVGERDIAWVFSIYVLMNLVGTPLDGQALRYATAGAASTWPTWRSLASAPPS